MSTTRTKPVPLVTTATPQSDPGDVSVTPAAPAVLGFTATQTEPTRARRGELVGNDSRYVVLRRLRCPDCDSPRVRAYRTIDQGDGSLLRYERCAECGAKFIAIFE